MRVTPRGGRDAFGAGTAEHFAVRLAAAPVEGAANAALIVLVTKAFGVRARDVSIEAGTTSRIKRLRIVGDPAALAQTAARAYAGEP